MNEEQDLDAPYAELDAWLDEHYAPLWWGCDDERAKDALFERLLEAIREWGQTP